MLANGKRLVTLHDARAVVLDVFGSVNTRSGALGHAIRRLLTVAESGKRVDIAEAATMLERVLSAASR